MPVKKETLNGFPSYLIKDMHKRDLTPEERSSYLRGSLHIAVINGRNEVVTLILQNRHQLEININDKFGSGYITTSYLMMACFYGHFEVCHLLLQQPDLDTNITTDFQDTAFILACSSGHSKIVNIMLEMSSDRKINLNHRGAAGRTGFVQACLRKQEQIVDLLVTNSEKYNIDLNAKDNSGKSGYDYWPEKFPNHFE